MTNVCNSSSSRPLTLVFLSTTCCLWVLVRVILQGQSQVNLSELRIIAGQEWLEQRTSLLVDAEAPCVCGTIHPKSFHQEVTQPEPPGLV